MRGVRRSPQRQSEGGTDGPTGIDQMPDWKYITSPEAGVDCRCRGCGWVFWNRQPEHGAIFVCPGCHGLCDEWGGF